jgi:putative hydrolase of the HAD superfamily
MASQSTSTVLLDALGTVLDLEPPAPRLQAALQEQLGLEISGEEADRAMRAEIAFYRAHMFLGRDADGLRDLRRGCVAAMRDALPPAAAAAGIEALTAPLLSALRFTAYEDAEPALHALRERGIALVVVSNWDMSLHGVIAELGLAELVDGVVTSAETGVAKPGTAIFERALELAGAAPAAALHAGDAMEFDVAGARAAGIRAVLVARDGAAPPAGVETVRSLMELPALVA